MLNTLMLSFLNVLKSKYADPTFPDIMITQTLNNTDGLDPGHRLVSKRWESI